MACKRKSCVYHTGNMMHSCNYYFVTGLTKLGQTPKGEEYSIENCRFYCMGKKRSATKSIALSEEAMNELMMELAEADRELVVTFFNYNPCDADIAMLLEVSPKTIVKIRRQKGLIRSHSQSGQLKRVNWDEAETMIEEGFSDVAVAMYSRIPLDVLKKFKTLLEKKKLDRGENNSDEVRKD